MRPARVFGQEVLEHLLPVFAGEVAEVERDAEPAADGHGVAAVVFGAAVAVAVVGPVLHEQAGHRFALLHQAPGGDGGVDAAGDAHHDARRVCSQGAHQGERLALAAEIVGDYSPDQRAAQARRVGA